MRQEVAQVNRDRGHCSECAEKELLPDGLVRVARPGGNFGRKILDLADGVAWQQELA
jgi:hypothetical protein